MSDFERDLLRHYGVALKSHLKQPDEVALHRAYNLGRDAAYHGLGILDMTTLHHSALLSVVARNLPAGAQKRMDEAYAFFAESLAPFEMLLRGYRETNGRLIETNKALQNVTTANETLLLAYERTAHVATRFQEAALPETLPNARGFRFDAYYRPASKDSGIGGDWYDAMRMSDGRIILSIGDVGGNGLAAAIIMVTIRQVIRGVAYIHADPILILDAAGKALRAEHPDLYVSAFVGVIDPIAMTLTYASAGHPPALLRYPNGSVEELNDDGVLLGIRVPGERTAQSTAIPAGSVLVLYTDGLIEGTADIIAGTTKLRDVVADRAVISKHDVARAIYEEIITEGAQDDVAILVIEVLPSPFGIAGKKRANNISRWMFDASDATAAQRARAEFTQELSAAGAHSDDVYAAELVFGELVGNVSRYAPGPVEIFVDWNGPAPVLHVRDQGLGFAYAPRLPRDPFSEKGRGLFIVAALTDDCNVTRMVRRGSHARAVIALNHNPISRVNRGIRHGNKISVVTANK
jgi:serine phosphatase RsbU (regulator of sigma subunit)/anti-sigma regulatory factor (Ser/Thr protein kinase)